MVKDLIDKSNGLSLREVLTSNMLDGTEAGSLHMKASAWLDDVIDLTYEWLTGTAGGAFDGREVSEVLAWDIEPEAAMAGAP